MKSMRVKDLQMATEVLQQYRDLSVKGHKFFHYTYGLLDIKLQSIEKNIFEDIKSELSKGAFDLNVRVKYEELKELFQIQRVKKRDIDSLLKNIEENSTITLSGDGIITKLFIYKRITVNTKEQYMEVEFNEDAISLFELIRLPPYTRINFNDIVAIDTKYQMNMYLYAMTILRSGGGIVTISIEHLKEILAKDNVLDNNNFVHRFVIKPSDEITNNKDISINIVATRRKNNIIISVHRKEVNENFN